MLFHALENMIGCWLLGAIEATNAFKEAAKVPVKEYEFPEKKLANVQSHLLWFPLYSVLHRRHSDNMDEYSNSTIQSLEEFMETSSVGEFRKRLQLIFAFLRQISAGLRRGCDSRLQGQVLILTTSLH